MLESTDYINSNGNNIPDDKIVLFPHDINNNIKENYTDIVEDLRSNPKRDWFNAHFYYCLPLTIGNQYGFGIKSMYDMILRWNGNESQESISISINGNQNGRQLIKSQFGSGIVTIQNEFTLRTPPGINIMTIQPPNYFIPGIHTMTGVIECDNIRRDFTFNIKITHADQDIYIKKGDLISAFIPIPRYFIDKFSFIQHNELFSYNTLEKEYLDQSEFTRQRNNEDTLRPHQSGRMYFNGKHAFGEKYKDHQKRISVNEN
jgi:hypothetical protein